MPTRSRDGPLTITYGNTLDVVVATPSRLNDGSHIASSAAITYGIPHASHPAIAALTATSSIVASRFIGGRVPPPPSGWDGGGAGGPRTPPPGGGRSGGAAPPPPPPGRSVSATRASSVRGPAAPGGAV